jgi:hypothetical protein
LSSPAGTLDLAARWRRLDKAQALKWTVYSLLLVNWVYYMFDEWEIASHTQRQGGSLLDWTREFATTIDEGAWFGLLFMFELETYILGNNAFENRRLKWTIHGVRLICYLFLAHTIFARVSDVSDYSGLQQATEITALCQVAEQDISFGENDRYEIVTADNCARISSDERFWFTDPTVITDSDGFRTEGWVRWINFEDAVTWLLVIWSIELAVWLQNRNVTGGALMLVSHAGKAFYAVLFLHMAWWLWGGHWVYAWDQFLWIAGFWAIEKNVADWRWEIREEALPG